MIPASETDLAALRRAIAALGPAGAVAAGRFKLGLPGLDAALGGGLARAALHEIHARQGVADAAAAGGFGLGLALRAAGPRPFVWVRQDFVDAETGGLYGDGLSAFGLDPGRLVVVRAQDPTGVLRAASEAARCPSVGATLVEIWGDPKVLDLKATRRLALAAGASGVTVVMIRLGATPSPGAATSRWSVEATASTPLEANAPGRPAFAAALLRHRGGPAGGVWRLEWDRDRISFAEAAPLSRPVVSVPARRPAAAGDATAWRRAG